MLKKVLIMSIAVAGCLGFGGVAAVAIHELFLCNDSFQYKSLMWCIAVVSILLVCAFFYLGFWICMQILAHKDCPPNNCQCKN